MPRTTAKKTAPKPSDVAAKKARASRADKKAAAARPTWSPTPIWDQMVREHGDPLVS